MIESNISLRKWLVDEVAHFTKNPVGDKPTLTQQKFAAVFVIGFIKGAQISQGLSSDKMPDGIPMEWKMGIISGKGVL